MGIRDRATSFGTGLRYASSLNSLSNELRNECRFNWKVAALAASRCSRYASRDEPALRANADQRLRTHVAGGNEEWRCELGARFPRLWMANRNPRGSGAGANGRIEPVCTVAGSAPAPQCDNSALQSAFRARAGRRERLREDRK